MRPPTRRTGHRVVQSYCSLLHRGRLPPALSRKSYPSGAPAAHRVTSGVESAPLAGSEVIVTDPQKISDRWPQIQAAFSSEGLTISLAQAINVLPKVQAALDGPVQPRPVQPALDLSTVRIVNAPDARGWAETARITRLSFDGATTRVEFSRQEGASRWPDLTPPGWDGPLQYTMWL